MRIIIEGIDRLGKSTLINNILKNYGPHPVIHCSSPPKGIENPAEYQKVFFKHCFRILDNRFNDVIFDRCHLGEYIYGPLYRKTDPNFIFTIESFHPVACNDTKLILLCTDNFNVMKDDGLSFDYSARDKEQDLFFEAFQKSLIVNKYILKVNDGESYRNENDIFNELDNWLKNEQQA